MKILLAVLLTLLNTVSFATEQAQEIFEQLAPSLYQIRIIDKASGEKSSIGSGFQITATGLIATNYHVISAYAQHPEQYTIEFNDHQGSKGLLTLKSVDVINDLALVQRDDIADSPYFHISNTDPMKGEELYSLGNPHDLGMIVVPGTNNGLKKESFNERIHFTGSVNPGMSGGPVVNKKSEVVGINVASSGNQIGFLVPHTKLIALYNDFLIDPPSDINQQISQQLAANQERFISLILASPWTDKYLGEGIIPTIDLPFIRCWGDSNVDKPDALILAAVANCSLDEDTYLSETFYTGSLEMEFRFMQAKDITDSKFYQLFQQKFSQAVPGNKASKNDVTEYECHNDIVQTRSGTMRSKAVFCTRAYKKFTGLFDVLYLAASVDKNNQSIVSHFTIAGVTQASANAFTKKFMESVSWK